MKLEILQKYEGLHKDWLKNHLLGKQIRKLQQKMSASLLIRARIQRKELVLNSHSLTPSTPPGTRWKLSNTEQKLNRMLYGMSSLSGGRLPAYSRSTSEAAHHSVNTLGTFTISPRHAWFLVCLECTSECFI